MPPSGSRSASAPKSGAVGRAGRRRARRRRRLRAADAVDRDAASRRAARAGRSAGRRRSPRSAGPTPCRGRPGRAACRRRSRAGSGCSPRRSRARASRDLRPRPVRRRLGEQPLDVPRVDDPLEEEVGVEVRVDVVAVARARVGRVRAEEARALAAHRHVLLGDHAEVVLGERVAVAVAEAGEVRRPDVRDAVRRCGGSWRRGRPAAAAGAGASSAASRPAARAIRRIRPDTRVTFVLHVTNGDSTVGDHGARADRRRGDAVARRPPRGAGAVAPTRRAAPRARGVPRHARSAAAPADVEAELLSRDERLAAALAEAEPVVLWFEHDLYDQLQLIQILAGLPDRPEHVELICVGSFPGPAGLRRPRRARARGAREPVAARAPR